VEKPKNESPITRKRVFLVLARSSVDVITCHKHKPFFSFHFEIADFWIHEWTCLIFQKLLEQGVRVGLETIVFMKSWHPVNEFWFSCFIMGCLR